MMAVEYKCKCMVEPDTVYVRYRRNDEDVITWMNLVTSAISQAHGLRSPTCWHTTMEYAKIPYGKDGSPVGAKP